MLTSCTERIFPDKNKEHDQCALSFVQTDKSKTNYLSTLVRLRNHRKECSCKEVNRPALAQNILKPFPFRLVKLKAFC